MNKNILKLLAVSLFAVLGLYALLEYRKSVEASEPVELPYAQFLGKAKSGEIAKVDMKGMTLEGKDAKGARFKTDIPQSLAVADALTAANVEVTAHPAESSNSPWLSFLAWLPVILILGVWLFAMHSMAKGGKGGNGPFGFGKSKARITAKTDNPVLFADIAGCEEAKQEVSEIVEFLRNPGKFHRLGGRTPKGVLLTGSPGTGKTLMAKAIAGEAGVPFFSISGSDFVEMFVGVGASRVRDLFAQAKKQAPCIVFIDEIDAVGRQRGAGHGGGNDEREQTLNQMLVEMDGFEENSGIVVVAATNRPDILDSALVRPGRFDRQVVVPLPDVKGRTEILKVHMRKTPVAADIQVEAIARGTPGFSGADLANLVNEAALFAARNDQTYVTNHDFELAKDKIMMGTERRSIAMSEGERINTAWHEAGHAVVARLLPKTDPVHKVSIIPRGRALGVTVQLPQEDRYSQDKERLLNTITVLFGGRVAEELFLGQVTTGAVNDFQRATVIARRMVTHWAMAGMGPMVFDEGDEGDVGRRHAPSVEVAREIDAEIRGILETQYELAKTLLRDREDVVKTMAEALLERETIDADEVNAIMLGLPLAAAVRRTPKTQLVTLPGTTIEAPCPEVSVTAPAPGVA